jgi:hypothetical protein
LEKFDVPDSGYETVIMLVELAPNVNTGLPTLIRKMDDLAHPSREAARLLMKPRAVAARSQHISVRQLSVSQLSNTLY